MKKLLSSMLICLLLACLTASSLAEAPQAASLSAKLQSVRGNASFTPESLPEIWITPLFDQQIIAGNEKYPPNFIHFAPPEGCAPLSFAYDSASFVNDDKLYIYNYQAVDKFSFEVFLEDAEEANTVKDGSEGDVAIYVLPDKHRARALLSLKEQFGKTAKLYIQLDDFSDETDKDALVDLISKEVERVTSAMQFEELDHYWSKGVFSSVEIAVSKQAVTATVDTADLTIVKLEDDEVVALEPAGNQSAKTEIKLETYTYTDSKPETKEVALADGTKCKVYNSDFISYASFVASDKGEFAENPLYLNITIDCKPDEFMPLLEKAYARVKLTVSEK